ncbi:MAG: hypothetical protein AB1921_00325 [Thermodesulfobacteriota bacterium]
MRKLGIRIEHDAREHEDIISPSYPLLAFSYYRSGFIRLAGNKKALKK